MSKARPISTSSAQPARIIDLDRLRAPGKPRNFGKLEAVVFVVLTPLIPLAAVVLFAAYVAATDFSTWLMPTWVIWAALVITALAFGYAIRDAYYNGYAPLSRFATTRLPMSQYFAGTASPDREALFAELQTTSDVAILPRSEDLTPPERNPSRAIASYALVLVIAVMIFMALIFIPLIKPVTRTVVRAAVEAYFVLTEQFSQSRPPPVTTTPEPGKEITVPRSLSSGSSSVISQESGKAVLMLVGLLGYLLRRNQQKSAAHQLEYDHRPPILYLRGFKDDHHYVRLLTTRGNAIVEFEDAVADSLSRVGPFVAIGAPTEWLPRLGAARAYVDDTVWRSKAEQWITSAHCIIVLAGPGAGLKWERKQIERLGLVSKTIHLVPPVPAKEAQTRILETNRDLTGSVSLSPATQVIAWWRDPSGGSVVVTASNPAAQDYECAIRLALRSLHLLGSADVPSIGPAGISS